MGYLSDVLLAVAFSNEEHRDEVWAVYCLDPRVQKHNLAKAWRNYDTEKFPILLYRATGVKWYDDYENVQGVEYMTELVRSFAKERGLHYASLYLRIGEEFNDMETARLYSDDDMACLLDVLWGIERRIAGPTR